MTYDHNTKAGNRGDVAKHVALIAALGEILKSWPQQNFRYADTFAGYAYNPLGPKSATDGWATGIGALADRQRVGQPKAPSLEAWLRRYVWSRQSPQYGVYPGSTVIALDVAAEMNRHDEIQVAAWDLSPGAVASLMTTLGTKRHTVHTREATHYDADVMTRTAACSSVTRPPLLNTAMHEAAHAIVGSLLGEELGEGHRPPH